MSRMKAFLLGVIAGSRSMFAPTVASQAARTGIVALENSPLAFLANRRVHQALALLSAGEFIADKLPFIPNRKIAASFMTRAASGALAGAAAASDSDWVPLGVVLGLVGAAVGTVGGEALRSKLSSAFGRQIPVALLEDVLVAALAIMLLQKHGEEHEGTAHLESAPERIAAAS